MSSIMGYFGTTDKVIGFAGYSYYKFDELQNEIEEECEDNVCHGWEWIRSRL